MSMPKTICLAILSLGLVIFLETGCATKKYVKQTADPVTGRIDELSELTHKNEATIKDVDSRAQSGIQSAQAKAGEVEQKTAAANQKADQASQMAQNSQAHISKVESSLNERIASIDNYKPIEEVSIQFKFDRAELTEESKLKLDDMAGKLKGSKNYVLEIRGFTDRTGDEKYNLGLSQRRSESVIRYFVQQHEIPLFRMFLLGLGESGEVQDNKTREGRVANRRVDVVLLKSGSDATDAHAGAISSDEKPASDETHREPQREKSPIQTESLSENKNEEKP
jgi:OOP family OmpA-OmpF porin